MLRYINSINADRKSIFAATLKSIVQHNSDPENTWTKGINPYSDMTHQEFIDYFNIVKADQVCTVAPPPSQKLGDQLKYVPASWDWRDFGIVTPVKNQGNCGSCWTFSTVGVIESHFMLKYG